MQKRTNLLYILVTILSLSSCDNNNTAPTAASVKQPENSPLQKSSKLDQSKIPLGQLSDKVTPLHYSLSLTLEPEAESYSGMVEIDLNFSEETQVFYLHGKDLDVTEVLITTKALPKGQPAEYLQVHKSGIAKITMKDMVKGKATAKINYQTKFSQSLDAIYQVKESGISYLFSQFEAISARMAFPSFDEPRFKTPFDVTIISNKKNSVITNTPEISVSENSEGLLVHRFKTSKKLPTYLLAFAVGEFDIVEWQSLPKNNIRNREVPLRGIAAKGKGKKLSYALENTQAILEALESYFATPYPYTKLDLIAAPDFAFGAMENAGAIVYRESLILFDDNASLSQKRAYGSVHAHELGHQWFGNLVTPTWWDDIWLNEAFATWVTQKAIKEWRPDFEFERTLTNRAHWAMGVDSRSSARQIRNPIDSNDDIMNAFDGITYSKGGGVLQMFESYLGEKGFRDGIKLHMQRYAFSDANIDDFLGSLAEGSGQDDLIPAFESFLYQSGVPMASIKMLCGQDNGALLNITQKRYVPLGVANKEKQVWQIPFCYKTDQGSDCVLLTEEQNTIELSYCPKWLVPNKNGSGYYRWNLSSDDWASLTKEFENLTAAEQISFADNLMAAFKAGQLSAADLINAYRTVAESKSWDVATIPANELSAIKQAMDIEPGNKNYQSLLTGLYANSARSVGYWPNTIADTKNASNTALLRSSIISTMALDANNNKIQLELVELIKAYLGGDSSSVDASKINSNIIDTAMIAYVLHASEKEVVDLKNRALNSTDAILRGNIFHAIAQTTHQAIGEELVNELLISNHVRSNEAQRLIGSFMANEQLREPTWNWLKENMDEFLKNYSSFSIARVVATGQYFCNESKKQEVVSFFSKNVEKISGAPRKIKETTEVIEQCIALRKTKSKEFNLALEKLNHF